MLTSIVTNYIITNVFFFIRFEWIPITVQFVNIFRREWSRLKMTCQGVAPSDRKLDRKRNACVNKIIVYQPDLQTIFCSIWFIDKTNQTGGKLLGFYNASHKINVDIFKFIVLCNYNRFWFISVERKARFNISDTTRSFSCGNCVKYKQSNWIISLCFVGKTACRPI